jgi:DNA-binding transcriptional ArsR family regulator
MDFPETPDRGPYVALLEGPSLLLGVMRDLDTIWGHARIGLCLTDAHIKGLRRSAREISENTGLHRDTVLKHLKSLEEAGRASSEKVGREVRYAAKHDWAERTVQKLLFMADWVFANLDMPKKTAE